MQSERITDSASRVFIGAFVTLLFVAVGCNLGIPGGAPAPPPDGTEPTSVFPTFSPAAPLAGDTVTFHVNAYAAAGMINMIRIDFENDGVWDNSKTISNVSGTAIFTHVYPEPGVFEVRVKAGNTHFAPAEAMVAVNVEAAPAPGTH